MFTVHSTLSAADTASLSTKRDAPSNDDMKTESTEKSQQIDEKEVSNRLYTKDVPDPDLIIRTSGEERISNFLLWQSAYSEFIFVDTYWPSFSKREFLRALQTYQTRTRRFGE